MLALLSLWSAAALADPAVVPMAPVWGDGATPVVVRFTVDGPAPSKVRAFTDAGKVGTAAMDGAFATVPFTPPKVDKPTTATITLRLDGVDWTGAVPIIPAPTGKIAVTFDPIVVTPGHTSTVHFAPERGSPIANEARRFVAVASAGTLSPVSPTGDGTWTATYTPPSTVTAPLPVLIGVADAAYPEVHGEGVLSIPTHGTVTFPVAPGSQCTLTVLGAKAGPVRAPDGKSVFEIDFDARAPTAPLDCVALDESKTHTIVDLPTRATPSATILPMTTAIPAGATIEVRVAVVGSDGSLLAAPLPKWTASIGQIGAPIAADGVFTATYIAPMTPGEAVLGVFAGGARAEAHLRVIPAIGTVILSGDTALSASATTLTLQARAIDAAGTAIKGQMPAFEAIGATIGTGKALPKETADGQWAVALTVPAGSGAVRFGAASASVPTGLPAARLVAWTDDDALPDDGVASTWLSIAAIDDLGVGVPGVALKLGVPGGTAALSASATTGSDGLVRVLVTAGPAAGLAALHIEGAGLETLVPLAIGAVPAPPPTGDPVALAAIARWKAAAPTLHLRREAPATAVPTATTPIAPATNPTTTTSFAVTPSIAPSGTEPATTLSVVPPSVAPSTSSDVPPTPAAAGAAKTLRLSGAVTNAHGSFSQTSDGTNLLLGGASFGTPIAGFWGITVDGRALPADLSLGKLEIDAHVAVDLEPYNVRDHKGVTLQRDLHLDAGFRHGDGPLTLGAALGVQSLSGSAFHYTDTTLLVTEPRVFGNVGARLAGRLYYETDALFVASEVAATFGIVPILLHAGVEVDKPLANAPVGLRLSAAGDLGMLNYRGDGKADTTAMNVVLGVGVAVAK